MAPRPVPKENILQLLKDAVAPSPEELAAYWQRVANRALKHFARRPLKLVRSVGGTTFYHRGQLPSIPPSVHQLTITKREGGQGTRVWVDSFDGLLGLLVMNAVELHCWNSTVDDLEHPDIVVFDLDPGSGVPFEVLRDTALELREVLRQLGLSSWPKLTGGKGIHVVAPLGTAALTHDEAHKFARGVANVIATKSPPRITLSAVEDRTGKLFVDYLRNGRGTTAVAPYSPRARPGFPIAAPTSWAKVERGVLPTAFNIHRPGR